MLNSDIFVMRNLTDVQDMERVFELQKICFDNPDNHIPLHTLISYAHNGGLILGAFEGEFMVGFAVAFLGTDSRDPRRPAMANLKLVMEGIAVHPDYRGNGIATRIAMQLREWSIQQGLRLVTRIFNPLNSRHAYFCIRKLGMMARRFIPNYYGNQLPSLVENTDQLLAEWWITQNRVEERLFGNRQNLTLSQYLEANVPIINPAVFYGNELRPYEGVFDFDGGIMLLVEIPADYVGIAHANQALAQAWQHHAHVVFERVYAHGYIATDFLLENQNGYTRTFYLMSYDGPRFAIEVDDN